jgi:hypothetical protein
LIEKAAAVMICPLPHEGKNQNTGYQLNIVY